MSEKKNRPIHSNSFVIINAVIVTQNAKRDVIHGSVVIQDGRIEKIISTRFNQANQTSRSSRTGRSGSTSKSDIPAAFSKFPVVDLNGQWLIPGFIQTHIHLCQTLFRGLADDLSLLDWLKKKIWKYEADHTYETLYHSARLGISECLGSGTTCVLDMGTVNHTEAIFKAAIDSGIRANIGKCLMDHPKTTPPNLRDRRVDAMTEALKFVPQYHQSYDDRIRVSLAPRFAISCTEKLLRDVAYQAKRMRLTIHTHANENRDEIATVKKMTGLSNIAYLDKVGLTGPQVVLAHAVWLSKSEISILKRTGTNITHCPGSNLKLGSGIANIELLKKNKINVCLGSDGAACNNTLDMFQEMKLAALLQKPLHGPKAMPAIEALDMATIHGAKAMQWSDQIGSIEIGKKADFFAFQKQNFFVHENNLSSVEHIASQLVYSARPEGVKSTWVNGVRVFQR